MFDSLTIQVRRKFSLGSCPSANLAFLSNFTCWWVWCNLISNWSTHPWFCRWRTTKSQFSFSSLLFFRVLRSPTHTVIVWMNAMANPELASITVNVIHVRGTAAIGYYWCVITNAKCRQRENTTVPCPANETRRNIKAFMTYFKSNLIEVKTNVPQLLSRISSVVYKCGKQLNVILLT